MSEGENNKTTLKNVVDISIKLLVLLGLIVWCLNILKPFISVFLWGIIIAITIFPLFEKIKTKIGNKHKLAAAGISILLLGVLILPAFLLAESMLDGVKQFGEGLNADDLALPTPPKKVAEWPIIGKTLYSTWEGASENIQSFIRKYNDQFKAAGQWFLNALLGASLGFLQLLISIIIAGILLASSEKGAIISRKLFRKLVAERGDEFADATEITIRNISKGVLGVAAIQSLLLGLIFFISGVPYAGLWAIICLILAVVQIGPFLVAIPVIIFYFVAMPTGLAIFWTVLVILGTLVDNYLKPILMGKGAPVPMLVIFLGAIGGFMASGFIGLFLGAIILSLGYKLFITWIDDPQEEKA